MSPDDPVHAPSELVETVLELLEDFNVPVPISDSIVVILERWERESPLLSPAPVGERHPNGEVRTCMKCGKRWWNDGRQFCECGGETSCGVTDPPPLTPAAIDLDELERLWEASTQGEYAVAGNFDEVRVWEGEKPNRQSFSICQMNSWNRRGENAAFIAVIHNAFPALIAAARGQNPKEPHS